MDEDYLQSSEGSNLLSSLGLLGLIGAGAKMAPIFKRAQGRLPAELHFPSSEKETMNKTLAWLTAKNQGGRIAGVNRKTDPMVFKFTAPDQVYDAIDRRIQQLGESTAGTSTPVKVTQMQASPAVNPVQQPVAHRKPELSPLRPPYELRTWQGPIRTGREDGFDPEAYLEIEVPQKRADRVLKMISDAGGTLQNKGRSSMYRSNDYREVEIPTVSIEAIFPSMDNPVFDHLARREKDLAFEQAVERKPDLANQYYDMADRVSGNEERLRFLDRFRSEHAQSRFIKDDHWEILGRYDEDIKNTKTEMDDTQKRIDELRRSMGY